MKLKTVFQDEAFKLGEVADVDIATMPDGRIKAQAVAKSGGVHTFFYDDLKTFANDWEDYEEPKKTWFIDTYGSVRDREAMTLVVGWDNKPIFEFETKEEAERAAEKLKAWTRLEDKAFRFTAWKNGIFLDGTIAGQVRYEFPIDNKDDIEKDLDLLFGGEE